MATTNFKGQPVKLIGEFIQVGKVAPDFELVKTDLSSFSLKDLNGKNVILNIFPSLDTSVCATSVRKFNKMAAGLERYGSIGYLQRPSFCPRTFLYDGRHRKRNPIVRFPFL